MTNNLFMFYKNLFSFKIYNRITRNKYDKIYLLPILIYQFFSNFSSTTINMAVSFYA